MAGSKPAVPVGKPLVAQPLEKKPELPAKPGKIAPLAAGKPPLPTGKPQVPSSKPQVPSSKPQVPGGKPQIPGGKPLLAASKPGAAQGRAHPAKPALPAKPKIPFPKAASVSSSDLHPIFVRRMQENASVSESEEEWSSDEN